MTHDSTLWWVGSTLLKVYSKPLQQVASRLPRERSIAQTHSCWQGTQCASCLHPTQCTRTGFFFQQLHKMRKRLIQIFGFLITSLGWLFVLCTMAMDYWRITQLGGQGGSFIIKVAWYWSNLWKDCFTDSTAVTNCRDFPVLWSVTRKCLIWILYNLLTLSTKWIHRYPVL